MTPMLSLYLALTGAAAPLVPALLRWRRNRGKEDGERLPERLGHASLPRPEGPLVWLHGASVGESMSVLPLIDRLREERPDVSILVTSGTATAARLLAQRLPEGVLHQFVPVDTTGAVSRFFDHWRPNLAVWIESELWPRLLRASRARGVRLLLINARMSARSEARWKRLRGTAAELLSVFDYVQAQDAATGRLLRELGVAPGRLVVAGSFKGAAAPLPYDADELRRLRDAIGARRVWVAASTHRGEEELALEAHRRILSQRSEALLVLAPRHPERGDEVAALLARFDLPWARRAGGPPPAGASVYLADTLGELGLWYRLSEVAFVGGSTNGVGGHNPFEPIALDVPVLHGPDTGNFSAIYGALDDALAARLVRSGEELAAAVLGLSGTAEGREMTRRAAEVAQGGADALAQALLAITSRLPAPRQGASSGKK